MIAVQPVLFFLGHFCHPPGTMASAVEHTLEPVLMGRAKKPGSGALAEGLRLEDKSVRVGSLL